MTTAAGIIIGDEILSGKVRDMNTPRLIDALREAGVVLDRIIIVPDDPDTISEVVKDCSERFDYVITSGGIGPTHDDRTMEGVAKAFDCPVVRHPELERQVRHHLGKRFNESALKLADIPRGGRLLRSAEDQLPLVVFGNIFILPGIPKFFSAKLRHVRKELRGQQRYLQSIYLLSDESSIAHHLRLVDREHPDVSIGSYPRIDNKVYRVEVIVKGLDAHRVEEAIQHLLELIPPDKVVRLEKGSEGPSSEQL